MRQFFKFYKESFWYSWKWFMCHFRVTMCRAWSMYYVLIPLAWGPFSWIWYVIPFGWCWLLCQLRNVTDWNYEYKEFTGNRCSTYKQ